MDSRLIELLALQLEWGVDEALDETPVDRRLPAASTQVPPAASTPVPPAASTLAPPPRRPAPALPLGTPAERARAAAALCDSPDDIRRTLQEGALVPELAALRSTAGSLVLSEGNPSAGLVLVGEAPGAEEDRAGRPFVGPAGQLLDRMLASIELDRSKLLLVMLVPWRPPGGRTPTEAELATCLPFLQRHLALLAPQHLVLFGNLAVRSLTGSTAGLRRLRGKWLNTALPGLAAPVPTLPMLPPSLLLTQPACKREAWADLLTLHVRRIKDGTIDHDSVTTKA